MPTASADKCRFVVHLDTKQWHSILHNAGISLCAERRNRAWAASLLFDASKLLRLPAQTAASAQLIMHRYCCRKAMESRLQLVAVISAALFIATKVEETRRKMRDILGAFHTLIFLDDKRYPQIIDVQSKMYGEWRDQVLTTEMMILSELGFMLECEKPHKFLFNYVQMLAGSHALAQRSCNFLNDALRSPICIEYPAHQLASAALLLASRLLRTPLPHNWHLLFDVKQSILHLICTKIIAVYCVRIPLHYEPLNALDAQIENERTARLAARLSLQRGKWDKGDPTVSDVSKSIRDTVITGHTPTPTYSHTEDSVDNDDLEGGADDGDDENDEDDDDEDKNKDHCDEEVKNHQDNIQRRDGAIRHNMQSRGRTLDNRERRTGSRSHTRRRSRSPLRSSRLRSPHWRRRSRSPRRSTHSLRRRR